MELSAVLLEEALGLGLGLPLPPLGHGHPIGQPQLLRLIKDLLKAFLWGHEGEKATGRMTVFT